MCATRLQARLQEIDLNLAAAFDYERGIGRAELLAIASQLDVARKSLLSAAADDGHPAMTWPHHCLEDYKRHRKNSQLGRILYVAKELRDAVDRVIILGPQPVVSVARAIFAAFCHPYHNELSRGQRGGRPRVYFLPAAPDNDSVQAILEILPRQRLLRSLEDRWAVVALDATAADESQAGELIHGLFLHLWESLQSTTTADEEVRLAAVVGPPGSSLIELAHEIGLDAVIHSSTFDIPHSASSLEPAVLLAGSIMGIDIVGLLRGAIALTERFATQPVGANPAIDFAGLQYLLPRHGENCGWRIASSASALEPLARCLHATNRGDCLLVQWIVESQRHDRLQISLPSGKTQEGRPKKIDRPLADVTFEQFAMLRSARTAAGKPTAVVRLPTIDEASIGQLVQMFSLASVVTALLNPRQSRGLSTQP